MNLSGSCSNALGAWCLGAGRSQGGGLDARRGLADLAATNVPDNIVICAQMMCAQYVSISHELSGCHQHSSTV